MPGMRTNREKSEPADPLICAHVAYLQLERGRGALTVDAYARDLEMFGAFLAGRLKAGQPVARIAYPDLERAATSDIRRFIMHLAGPRGYNMVTVRRKTLLVEVVLSASSKWRTGARTTPPFTYHRPKWKRSCRKCSPSARFPRSWRRASPEGPISSVRDCAIMELLYASGIRRAEVAAINVNDMDLESRTIR